jgi:superoxide reductase
MENLIANTVDASVEKHVPVFNIVDNIIEIKVGNEPHPMTQEHYIEWIYLETKQGGQRKALLPENKPEAKFSLIDDELSAVYAYCNLHGLWKASL